MVEQEPKRAVLTEEKLASMISGIVNDALDKRIGQQNQTGPQVLSQAKVSDSNPKPMHYQQFNVVQSGDEMEIGCPTCGGYQSHVKAPVVVKEKPVEVVKTQVPDNFMPVPSRFDDIKHIMDELEHPGGHHLWDCPNCAPKMEEYLNSHGWSKQQVKKR